MTKVGRECYKNKIGVLCAHPMIKHMSEPISLFSLESLHVTPQKGYFRLRPPILVSIGITARNVDSLLTRARVAVSATFALLGGGESK